MKFNFEKLSDQELIQLNRHIVEIIRTRRQRRTDQQLSKFYIGEHVEFKDEFGELIKGVVVRVNQKTITIQTHQPCSQWRVSPHIVSKCKATPPHQVGSSDEGNVTHLFKT